ncbi:MAG: aspartate carbamoyltransferase, partial [Candidatus Azambacteria bacterium]|nr:aspartate carbamoyltransferase [Candidatus Azambacteria bacterium]
MRHLLGIAELSREQIERLLDRADSLAQLLERENKKLPALSGRTIVNLFFEDSTR